MKYPKLVIIIKRKKRNSLKFFFLKNTKLSLIYCQLLFNLYVNYVFYGLSKENLKSLIGFSLLYTSGLLLSSSKYILQECKQN